MHEEPMILSFTIDENLYDQGSLKDFLKLFKCPTSLGIYMIARKLDLIFNTLLRERGREGRERERERERKGENLLQNSYEHL